MVLRTFLMTAIITVLAADLGLALYWKPGPAPHARTLPAPRTGPAYAVADAAGSETRPEGGDIVFQTDAGARRLADFRGRVVVLYFGYTFCPDVCPTALLDLTAALKEFPAEEITKLQPVFLSLDPARDTPSHLAAYVRFFHPALLGGSPGDTGLSDAARRYGIRYASQATPGAAAYTVDHSSVFSIIDPAGRLVAQLPHGTPPSALAAAIRHHLSHS